MCKEHKTNITCECCGKAYRAGPGDVLFQYDNRSELAKWFYEDDLSYYYYACPHCGHRHELLFGLPEPSEKE